MKLTRKQLRKLILKETDWAMSSQDQLNSGQLEAGLKSALTELLTQNMAMGADEKMIERALESALVQAHASVRGSEMIFDVEISMEDPRSDQTNRSNR